MWQLFWSFVQILGFDTDLGYGDKTNFLRNIFLKKIIDSTIYTYVMFIFLSVCLFVIGTTDCFCFKGTCDEYHVVNTVQCQPHIILTKIITILNTVFMYISGYQGLVIVNIFLEFEWPCTCFNFFRSSNDTSINNPDYCFTQQWSILKP